MLRTCLYLVASVVLLQGAAHADDGVGIPGLRLDMPIDAVKERFGLQPEKPHPGPMALPVFPGTFDGTIPYKLAGYSFDVTVETDLKTNRVDFFSLHQYYPRNTVLPNFKEIETALTEKYGEPFTVQVHNDLTHTYDNRQFWLSNGAEIEYIYGDRSSFGDPFVVIYYHNTAYGQHRATTLSALANGL